MKTQFVSQKGFSLVEVMVVVAIIGILATLAVPRFQVFQARAKQQEARTNLSHIHTMQTIFHGEQDTYGTLADIGFSSGVEAGRAATYVYTMPAANATGFTAQASASTGAIASCAGVDTWQMNQDRDLTNTVAGLGGC